MNLSHVSYRSNMNYVLLFHIPYNVRCRTLNAFSYIVDQDLIRADKLTHCHRTQTFSLAQPSASLASVATEH